ALLLGWRIWPGIFVGAFLANITTQEPVGVAWAIATGNTLEALAGAALLRRAGCHPSLDRVRDVLWLLAAAAVCTPVSATIGVCALCLGRVHPWSSYGSLWSIWWLGDAMGALVMAPVPLTWAGRPRRAGRETRLLE